MMRMANIFQRHPTCVSAIAFAGAFSCNAASMAASVHDDVRDSAHVAIRSFAWTSLWPDVLAAVTLVGVCAVLHRWRVSGLLRTLKLQEQCIAEHAAAFAAAGRLQIERQSELTRFLAVASHDLRQPMHALNLYLGILLNAEMPEKSRSLITSAYQCAQIMDGMFLDLVNLSRLDAHAVKPNISCFAIEGVLSRVAAEYGLQAEQKGIEFSVEHCGAFVESDMELVEQILGNLCANSVRYTETGKIAIRNEIEGDKLRIAVQDTGIGIAPEQQTTVFRDFVGLHSTNQGMTKGLGLGLAIVKRLCTLLGLSIALSSTLGKGSTFTVDLPLGAKREVGEEPTGRIDADAVMRGKMVVVVEDDTHILRSLSLLLEQWQCTVIAAESGAAAVAKMAACTSAPDLLICDYRLRVNETGLDAIDILRTEFNCDIPAALITGDTSQREKFELARDKFIVLYKPLQATQMQEILARFLSA